MQGWMVEIFCSASFPKGEAIVISHACLMVVEMLKWRFTRSSGPGGQHVNTTNSKCELSIAADKVAAFVGDERVIDRFRSAFKVYLTERANNICIKSQEFRVQEQNKNKCLEKLVNALNEASRMIQITEPNEQQKERISIL